LARRKRYRKRYRTPFGSELLDFLDAAFQLFGSDICGENRMKPYPLVEELLAPVLGVGMPCGVDSPAFLRC